MEPNTKSCHQCKKLKPLNEFYTNRACKDKKCLICKYCSKDNVRIWQINNKEKKKVTLSKWKEKKSKHVREYGIKYYLDHRDEIKKWLLNNRDKKNAQNIKWNAKNKDKKKLFAEKWRANNPSRHAELERIRNGVKKQATPSWANRDSMNLIYAKASNLSISTGILHHVDHIVPLKGQNVSGFHCEYNLQILTATENIKKSNKLLL